LLKLACSIPGEVVLACSGGKDSMAALNFLLRGKRKVKLAYFNHGTDHSAVAESFVKSVASHHGLDLILGKYIHENILKLPSEADWRDQRYDFFRSINKTILTAHHLNDVAEWWLFTSFRGNPKTIPIKRSDPEVIRPFIKTTQEKFHSICRPKKWVKDPSNLNKKFSRNKIRHDIMPSVLKVNPGFLTTVRNLYD
jgi:tRNA(Ile)-lysidine synthase